MLPMNDHPWKIWIRLGFFLSAVLLGASQQDPLDKGRDRSLNERRLREKLLDSYDKAIMPNGNDTTKFLMRMEMILTGIVEVDVRNQRALITAWIKMEWSDTRLQWNVTDNSNLRSLAFSQEDIYIPEIVLFNRYRVRSSEIFGSSMAIVYSSGEVTWIPAASLEVPCNMSLTTWPNDQHECDFVFGHASRDRSTFEATPSSREVSLESFVPTSMQWELVGSRAERSHSYGFQDDVDNVRFHITVKRVSTPLLRSFTFTPVLLLLLSVGVLLIGDPSLRFLYATLNLTCTVAFAFFVWCIVPSSDGPIKTVRLVSYSAICIFVVLCLASFLDFLEGVRYPVPPSVHRLCDWSFTGMVKSRWPWNRQNTSLSSHVSSENLVLSDDDTARNRRNTRLLCHFAPHCRTVFLLLYTVTIEKAKFEQGSDRDQNQIQAGSLFVESDRQGNENLLRTLLIHNGIYDRRHHPVFDRDVLNVSMSLALLNLIQINEFKETISVTAEMAFKWYDQHISWEPLRFANISVLPVSDTDIYHPEVILTNALFHTDQRPFASSMALLHSSGKVLWFPRATLKTRCQVDPLLWPYTALQCDFKFGVPVHDTRVRLLLRSKHIFVKLYAPHHSWTVIKASQFIMNASNTDLQERYGTEELPWFRLHLRKTPSTFGASVLIAPLVVLVLNGFLLMHNWNSDAHYIACAFSLIFFGGQHAIISVWIPPSPTLPWFGLFLALSSMLVLFTLFSLPLFAHFHPRNHQQLALPKAVLVLAKLLTRPFAALGSMGGLREGTSKYSDFSSTMKSHNVVVSSAVRSCIALIYWTSAVCISLLTLRHFYRIESADSEGSD